MKESGKCNQAVTGWLWLVAGSVGLVTKMRLVIRLFCRVLKGPGVFRGTLRIPGMGRLGNLRED